MGVSWGAGTSPQICLPDKGVAVAYLASRPFRGLGRALRKLLVGSGAHVRR